MRRSLTLTALLLMALSVAACGESEPQQRSERGAPAQEKQSAPSGGASRENARGGEGSEAAGLSVTTLQGEEVKLGGQGDVTALYFMAGW